MSRAALVAQGISKRYPIGSGVLRYGRLTESLWERLRHPGTRRAREADGHVWALRDVSLEVAEGEVVGIIGSNGSGKTTLLKVLSRITEPTHGKATVNGRVGSLLEVGTGFHPELTGRENVFLNGAILGMRKAEVQRKFDEIVSFAEVERFLDTPVKRYSSGMQVRLAFAVAAHLEPEILLVDEVLAVGDAEFQRKCLGKIDEVSRGGRTVLFVSHNMAAVESLCSRAVLLREGRVESAGTSSEVVARYVASTTAFSPVVEFSASTPRRGNGAGRLTGLQMRGAEGQSDVRLLTGRPFTVRISFRAERAERAAEVGLLIRDRYDRYLIDVRNVHGGTRFPIEAGGNYMFEVSVAALPLYPGEYTMGVWVSSWSREEIDYIPDACPVVVEDDGALLHEGTLDPKLGEVFVESEWSVDKLGAGGAGSIP